MGLGRSAAVVMGRRPLGERDRLVTFFTRDFGKVHGVARSARRVRSRFAGTLEPFTQGQLVFFDTGQSDLVRVDHFDVSEPFAAVRDDLERLGEAAWIVECVNRLTADRDANPAVYGQLVRALDSLARGHSPGAVAVAFGVRCIDTLGHRLRLDRCVACGRPGTTGLDVVRVDVEAGGVLCGACGRRAPGSLLVSRGAVAGLARLRTLAWTEATAVRLGPAGRELRELLETHVSRLIGHPTRAARFLREVSRAGGGWSRP
jgi:DNA repair protein RecO (recombination protein O)